MKRIAYFTPILSLLLLLAGFCSCDSEKPPAAPTRGRLTIEAQIIYNMGGPQPVARESFHLLDADVLDIEVPRPQKGATSLKDALSRLTPVQNLKLRISMAQYNQRLRDAARQYGKELPDAPSTSEEDLPAIAAAIDLMKIAKDTAPHFVQSAVTDFQGRTTFENVEPGDYWIMGATKTRSDYAFWNYKVSVKPGEDKVLLDQNNALYSK